ncbi:unnamed protein product [Mytilus edulis]|uniref:Uncharacterized protein n=3 Tax=Mytilus TaxID=6548 RepID=A0A8B6EVW3_MYTGA|nr:unnamed protein product [Mytilus edulis]VDI40795.1 Hypothetical predicted protein [Mytilus galloprovincialis]
MDISSKKDFDSSSDFWSSTVDKEREVEVLHMKIDIDARNHEREKESIHREKDGQIEKLKSENDHLKEEMGSITDKIKQLDLANSRKDKEIEESKLREKELKKDIQRLEKESILQKVQKKEIKRLKDELAQVRLDLQQMKLEKDEVQVLLKTHIEEQKTRDTKMMESLKMQQREELKDLRKGLESEFKELRKGLVNEVVAGVAAAIKNPESDNRPKSKMQQCKPTAFDPKI